MTKKELSSILRWDIDHGRGFLYQGELFNGMRFHDDKVDIHFVNWKEYREERVVFDIELDDIVEVRRVRLDGEEFSRKEIITK